MIPDFAPGYEGDAIVVSGFSGHGFKFASSLGEIMFDLAIKGSTNQSIEFLRANRFQ